MAITPVDLSVTNITATSVRLNWVAGALNPLQALISALFGAGEQGAFYIPQPVVNGAQALFQNAAGTVPVTADGDPVGRMLDQSGNGSYASQAISSKRMLYSDQNGLLQDRVDDVITINGLDLVPASGSKTWTLCVGYSDLGSEAIILINQANSDNNFIGVGRSNSSTTISSIGSTQDLIYFDGILENPSTQNEMLTLMRASSVIVIEFTVSESSTAWDAPSFGKYFSDSALFYGPKKSEFLMIVEGSLTESQRKNVEAYAAQQAGTTI